MEAEFSMGALNNDIQEDRYRLKVKRKRDRWEANQRKSNVSSSSQKSQNVKTPKKSSSSLDLEALPVTKFHYTSLRQALLLKFFIKHFIHMAQKSLQFFAYSQATMYVLHVENLCEILANIRSEAIDAHDFKVCI